MTLIQRYIAEHITHGDLHEGLVGRCWLWNQKLHDDGYARPKLGGRRVYAHRLSWEAFIGPISEWLELDHRCRVKHCVNPDHLEPVTGLENLKRQAAARRARKAQP